MYNSNEYAYAKQFEGNLRVESKAVPLKLTTRLRLTENSPTETRKHRSLAFDKTPHYVFGGGDLPVDPNMQAKGRHYFTW